MNIRIIDVVSILMPFPSNYVIYILLVFLLIDFSLIMDIFFLLYTSGFFFFFLNLIVYLNQNIIILQHWDETKTNTFTIYTEILNWIVDVVTLPLDAGFFLNFLKYSFHCLQTLLISWKQLHFLKVCCKVL